MTELIPNRTLHYCKMCQNHFVVRPPIGEADVFLVCPSCGKPHFRHFEAGVAVHCDLSQARGKIVEIKGALS